MQLRPGAYGTDRSTAPPRAARRQSDTPPPPPRVADDRRAGQTAAGVALLDRPAHPQWDDCHPPRCRSQALPVPRYRGQQGRSPKSEVWQGSETWPPLIRARATPAATTSWGASRPRRNRRTGQGGSVSAPSTRIRSWVGSIPHPTEHPARPTYAALRRPWVDLFSGWSAPSLAAADRPGSAGPAL